MGDDDAFRAAQLIFRADNAACPQAATEEVKGIEAQPGCSSAVWRRTTLADLGWSKASGLTLTFAAS